MMAIPAMGLLGILDSLRFPTAAWQAVRWHAGVFRWVLFGAVFLWVLFPAVVFYWLVLRWRLAKTDRTLNPRSTLLAFGRDLLPGPR